MYFASRRRCHSGVSSQHEKRQVWILIFCVSIRYMLSIADITDWWLFKQIGSLGKTSYWLWMFVPFSHWRMLFFCFPLSLSVCVPLAYTHTHTCTITHACPFVLENAAFAFCATLSCQSYACASFFFIYLYITTYRITVKQKFLLV